MFNVMEEVKGTKVCQRKWSQFVELNKYFRAPLMHSQSVPCVPMRSAPARGKARLSLSWQLACNPADSTYISDDCVQRPDPKSEPHEVKPIKRHRKPKSKSLTRKVKPKQSPVSLPKIMVVDAIQKPAGAKKQQQQDHQAHGDRWDRRDRGKRETQPKESQDPRDKSTTVRAKKPRAEVVNKSKRSFGVPLCHRPTMLLGPRYHQDLQQYNQQQYYYQLQQQQQQQQQMQQSYYNRPMQHIANSQHGYYQGPRYAVPIESMYHNIKRGNRYCGNFYYR